MSPQAPEVALEGIVGVCIKHTEHIRRSIIGGEFTVINVQN